MKKTVDGKPMVYIIDVDGQYKICYMNEQYTGYTGQTVDEAVALCAKHSLELVSIWF